MDETQKLNSKLREMLERKKELTELINKGTAIRNLIEIIHTQEEELVSLEDRKKTLRKYKQQIESCLLQNITCLKTLGVLYTSSILNKKIDITDIKINKGVNGGNIKDYLNEEQQHKISYDVDTINRILFSVKSKKEQDEDLREFIKDINDSVKRHYEYFFSMKERSKQYRFFVSKTSVQYPDFLESKNNRAKSNSIIRNTKKIIKAKQRVASFIEELIIERNI